MVQIVIEKDMWNSTRLYSFCPVEFILQGPHSFGFIFVRKHGFEPWPSVSNGAITIGDDALES